MMQLISASSLFQSTLPAWGATIMISGKFQCAKISIHAPRMGSDILLTIKLFPMFPFQSTLPAWGATPRGMGGNRAV